MSRTGLSMRPRRSRRRTNVVAPRAPSSIKASARARPTCVSAVSAAAKTAASEARSTIASAPRISWLLTPARSMSRDEGLGRPSRSPTPAAARVRAPASPPLRRRLRDPNRGGAARRGRRATRARPARCRRARTALTAAMSWQITMSPMSRPSEPPGSGSIGNDSTSVGPGVSRYSRLSSAMAASSTNTNPISAGPTTCSAASAKRANAASSSAGTLAAAGSSSVTTTSTAADPSSATGPSAGEVMNAHLWPAGCVWSPAHRRRRRVRRRRRCPGRCDGARHRGG